MSVRKIRPAPEPELPTISDNKKGLGRYIIKPEYNVVVRRPSWNGTETVIRPYPSVRHDDDTQFWPYRLDPGGKDYFGYWIKKVECAWSVGNPPISFLIEPKPNDGNLYDPFKTPLGILYKFIKTSIDTGRAKPEWYQLINKHLSEQPALRMPSKCCMIQGLLLVHNSEALYLQPSKLEGLPPNPALVLILSHGASKQLIDMLNMENENFKGDPADFENRFVYGDPVDVNKGRFIHFIERGKTPKFIQTAKSQPKSLFNQVSQRGYQQQSTINLKGYDITFLETFENIPAKIENPDVVRQMWHHWEDILYFPSVTEQAHLLAERFPASAIVHAFSHYNQDWVPDHIKKKAKEAVSVSVKGSKDSNKLETKLPDEESNEVDVSLQNSSIEEDLQKTIFSELSNLISEEND